MTTTPIVDSQSVDWIQHPRFASIGMRPLLTSAENPFASANIVRIPVGDEVPRHLHATQIETVYMLAGRGVLTLGETDHEFHAGGIVAIPSGLEHRLRNAGDEPIDLLTFFTPPLV